MKKRTHLQHVKERIDVIQFIQYPKCGTCRNAKKYLQEKGAQFVDRNIVEQPPTKEELREWIAKSRLDPRKWLNTSGRKYKELNLKDMVKTMTDVEIYELLSSDGMLVKRPILVCGDQVTVGFKPEVFDQVLGK
ncbi:arsenate reductase family protein [Fodinisporobacter ferrooxydans]|uniref:Arsenate reductase family protein n=1 Tax=Fodinisporobacter ferrooxydans TaxID=2901836 RepID=A0ABY4CPJ1_9BACL|nr:arsenate reductase family protein [Alicyclobacillaceae bacterium MYW30-H2]